MKDQRLAVLIEELSSRVSVVPVPGGLKIELPDEDDREDLVEAASDGSIGHAEGQTFTIEYRDSRGQISVRRVTAWHLTTNWEGVPRMLGYCHERGAQRTFRLDRVIAAVDVDGHRYQPPDAFFTEIFGMPPKVAAAKPPKIDRVREICHSDITLLSAMAHSDGHADLDEIGVIIDHCAEECRRANVDMDEACEIRLRNFIARNRPTSRQIGAALDRLCNDSDRAVRIISSASAVMEADGRLLKGERRLLDDMMQAVGAA